jgi:perosamine synthetase
MADVVTPTPSPSPAPAPRRVPIAGPSITDHEVDAVTEAVRNAWYEHANDGITAFEAAFATYTGRRHAVALPSCTAALHLSLAALGIGAGDEVVVADATWIATSAPITYVGATPVFADVDRDTWCLDPVALERAITPRTRAVIAVDLYGGMPAFDEIASICAVHDVVLIEDAAEAVGSRRDGRRAGGFGACSTFSFHGSKTLTTGEGGMWLTDDDALVERVLFLRDHGRRAGDTSFFNTEVAFKYKMSAMQAALGHAQLERVDELVAAKRRIFAWYADRLSSRPGIRLNAEPARTSNSYWMTTIVIGSDNGSDNGSAALAASLAEVGIATRPFFHPLSSLPAYAGLPTAGIAAETNVVSRSLARFGLNLPSALSLTEDDIDYVCWHLNRLLDRNLGP